MKFLKDIGEGYYNSWLQYRGTLDPAISKMGEQSISICVVCPVRTGIICNPMIESISADNKRFRGCNCVIPVAVLAPNKQCPGGYWKQMVIPSGSIG